MSWAILEGDCIDAMRILPAESVDAIVTSPPYAMQRKATYGGVPEADYPAWTVAWMGEARRLLKPDGSVIINIRPHKSGGQLSDYVMHTRLALRASGWLELDEIVWHKPDAMPTAPTNRPRRAWESLLWYSTSTTAWADPHAAGQPYQFPERGRTSFDGPDRARRAGWGHAFGAGAAPLRDTARVSNLVRVSKSEGSKRGVDHPAPYPPALAEWVGKLICPQGGTILDPFSGSASTGVACIRNGWDYIGIEAMPEYAAMSRKRLAHTEAEQAA